MVGRCYQDCVLSSVSSVVARVQVRVMHRLVKQSEISASSRWCSSPAGSPWLSPEHSTREAPPVIRVRVKPVVSELHAPVESRVCPKAQRPFLETCSRHLDDRQSGAYVPIGEHHGVPKGHGLHFVLVIRHFRHQRESRGQYSDGPRQIARHEPIRSAKLVVESFRGAAGHGCDDWQAGATDEWFG